MVLLLSIWSVLSLIFLIPRNDLAVSSAFEQETQSFGSPSLAEQIVQQAYNDTFTHIVKSCPKTTNIEDCFQNFYNINSNRNMDITLSGVAQHWWFRSMVRDAYNIEGDERVSYLAGPWHVAQASNPNVSMCMIEKIGIKQWQEIFRGLNNGEGFRSDKDRYIDLPGSKEGYPSFVFFRDPLERFLSAYLDKCVDGQSRKIEKHCEPNSVFNVEVYTKTSHLNGFTFGSQKRAMFSAYVDVMPLKWNMHFFPQSLYCNGVYRYLDDYDFVGFMDSSFYQSLHKLGKRYGGRFEERLDEVFKLSSKQLNATNAKGIETNAANKVNTYYTPRSLRRVLEYVSIDYVLLGMKIPEWAESMLREDE